MAPDMLLPRSLGKTALELLRLFEIQEDDSMFDSHPYLIKWKRGIGAKGI